MRQVCEIPLTSFRARRHTVSPLTSLTESRLNTTLPPIPRKRLCLTRVTEPCAALPAGMMMESPTPHVLLDSENEGIAGVSLSRRNGLRQPEVNGSSVRNNQAGSAGQRILGDQTLRQEKKDECVCKYLSVMRELHSATPLRELVSHPRRLNAAYTYRAVHCNYSVSVDVCQMNICTGGTTAPLRSASHASIIGIFGSGVCSKLHMSCDKAVSPAAIALYFLPAGAQ